MRSFDIADIFDNWLARLVVPVLMSPLAVNVGAHYICWLAGLPFAPDVRSGSTMTGLVVGFGVGFAWVIAALE